MKTILTHFHNEEFLLPFWLRHYKQYFDHGILVDADSTDHSVEIIKEICPTWQIVPSRSHSFDSDDCDREMESLEHSLTGWRASFMVTEFLIGNFDVLDREGVQPQFKIPAHVMVDTPEEMFTPVDNTKTLFEQRHHGIHLKNTRPGVAPFRDHRSLHNYNLTYAAGRHWSGGNTSDFVLCWYRYSPFTEEAINRILRIGARIPQKDKDRKFGVEHYLATRDSLLAELKSYQAQSEDLAPEINRYLHV